MPEIKPITRKLTYWTIIAWIVLIPACVYLISLPCYAPTSISETRNDALEWMSIIGIGLLTFNAIYISFLEITLGRIEISSWLTKSTAIITLFISIILGFITAFGWYLSAFYPQVVSYFGEDPKGMPTFASAMFIYLILLIALSIHTYRTHLQSGSESNAT